MAYFFLLDGLFDPVCCIAPGGEKHHTRKTHCWSPPVLEAMAKSGAGDKFLYMMFPPKMEKTNTSQSLLGALPYSP